MNEILRRKIEQGLRNLEDPNSAERVRMREAIDEAERDPEYQRMIRAIENSERLTAEDYAITINYIE